MAFHAVVLRDRQFSAHLTEDIEFQLELLLDGVLVAFLPNAVVKAEMPLTFTAATTQNERWELGRLQLARRYLPKLVRRAVRPGPHGRAAPIDAALDQLVPPLSVLAAGTAALLTTTSLIHRRSGMGRAGLTLASASALGLVFHVLGGLRLADVPRSTYAALALAPRLVVWKVLLWLKVWLRPDEVSWTRTARNAPCVG